MSKKYRNSAIVEENYILKKYNKNIFDIYEILELSGFNNYPKIIEFDDKNIKYEYIKKEKHREKIKNEEFIKTISLLHSKTLELKEVSLNKYTNIKNTLTNNINYMKKYYEGLINNIDEEIYMRPSSYLIARNYSIILLTLETSEKYLKKWFKIVENKTNERVCVVHNNLSKQHFIKADINYLISFDRAMVDTPVLDLYKLYKKECLNIDFNLLFDIYNQNFELLEEEKYLFYTLITIPPKIERNMSEYENTNIINDVFRYIYKTINFVNKK